MSRSNRSGSNRSGSNRSWRKNGWFSTRVYNFLSSSSSSSFFVFFSSSSSSFFVFFFFSSSSSLSFFFFFFSFSYSFFVNLTLSQIVMGRSLPNTIILFRHCHKFNHVFPIRVVIGSEDIV